MGFEMYVDKLLLASNGDVPRMLKPAAKLIFDDKRHYY